MCPVPKAPPSAQILPTSAAQATTDPEQNSGSSVAEGVVAGGSEPPSPEPVNLTPAALLARITDKIFTLGLGPDCYAEPLSRYEETCLHHLVSVTTDWTLMMDRRLAANCRNISDEVFPGIHLGDKGAAINAFYLKKIGVTHVLNTAEGKRRGLVDTNEDFYYPYGIKYKGLKLLDVAQTNIKMHFVDVAHFIDDALSSGGKVLVNCLMGMSRSSTCVLAYLMIRQNMTAIDALTVVRRHREIRPNDGFLKQLADLDNELRRERGQLIPVK